VLSEDKKGIRHEVFDATVSSHTEGQNELKSKDMPECLETKYARKN
jgi:hypothetical protein